MPQDDTRILDAFVRDARFETGIPLVDAQHQQLVKALNSLGLPLAAPAST
jgi:hemerythrin